MGKLCINVVTVPSVSGDDVGSPSLCYEYVLLLLVIKEAVWANGLVEQSQVRNLNRDIEKK